MAILSENGALGHVEMSDPEYERDRLRSVTFRSPALGHRADLTLFVPPPRFTGPLSLVILLHGVYGSHWAWAFKAGAHLTALELIEAEKLRPCVLAMPSDGLWSDGSGYVAHRAGADYERFIVEDVPACARLVVPQLGGERFIGGLSMGGYGALRLAAKYPERFKAVAAHSSVTELRQLERAVVEMPRCAAPGGDDVLDWMQRNRAKLPRVRFDCGVDDHLLAANRALHQALLADGIEHEYAEHPGGHDWPYWTQHVRDSLLFFERSTK